MGRPSSSDPKLLINKINDLNLPNFCDINQDMSLFLNAPFQQIVRCQLCQCIPSRPVQITTCEHFLCASCILREGYVSCPCDGDRIKAHELWAPSLLALEVLKTLLVRCSRHCCEVVELQHLRHHLASSCANTVIPPLQCLCAAAGRPGVG